MTREDFFESMKNIDASLIERADKEVTVKKRRPMLKIAAIAASFAVLVVGLVAVLPSLIGDDGPIVQDAIVWADIADLLDPSNRNGDGEKIFEVPQGLLEKSSFAEIIGTKYENYKKESTVPSEFIGEKIDEVEVRTGWYLHLEKKEKDVKTVKAEVYAIKYMSTDAAVAIRFLEKPAAETTEHYYAAVNTEYEFGTLSQFFGDYGAEDYMTVKHAVYMREQLWGVANGAIDIYRLTESGAAEVCKLLLTLDGEVDMEHKFDAVTEKLDGCKNIIRIMLTMEGAGGKIVPAYVFDNGYIAIFALDENYAFYNVGEANTDLIFDAVKEYGEKITNTAEDPQEYEIVEVTSSALDEYVPE